MRTVSLSLFMLIAACGVDEATEVTPAEAPGAKADGYDRADRSCQIVLRTLAQPPGLPSHDADGVNWVVYTAHVDVADAAEGAPMALYTSGSRGWFQVEGVPVAGAPAGYQRYAITLDRYTVPMGDNTAWRHMRIEVIPFLASEHGRLFDHNRNAGDFDNYVITKDRTWYGDDPAVCY